MPKIDLKTPGEIAIMAEGGEKLGKIISRLLERVTPGLSTLEIDSWIEKEITASGATPSFKKVPRYHWASCVGINEEVVHSIPRKDKILKEGDLLKIDAGVFWQGFNTDASWTIRVRKMEDGRRIAEDRRQNDRFLETGKKALREAIAAALPGKRVGDISSRIEEVVRQAGYAPVEALSGHGVGRKLHEEPLIPCFLKDKVEQTPLLKAGMTLAIEIIYTLGKPEVTIGNDDWTISTKDGKISGLFEETIAVGENGPLILTEVRE